MGRAKEAGKTKQTKRINKQPQGINTPPEDRLRIFANLLIDRFLEDQANGTFLNLTKNKET